MKCLQLAGDQALAWRFIQGMAEAISKVSVMVATRDSGGEIVFKFPGKQAMTRLLRSIPPDLVILNGPPELAAPVVWCGTQPPEDMQPLILHTFTGDEQPADYRLIFKNTFNLLPQRTSEECGRCGTDCRGLAEAIIKGKRNPGDCFNSPGKTRIMQDGADMEVGDFPSRMVESTIRGLLSSLKGYREGSEITILLQPESAPEDS